MKLEYFKLHGRAMMIRMALAYCNVEYQDYIVTSEEFYRKKKGGAYPLGQVPTLYLDDGTALGQSKAILRYVCAKYKGENGESLYPGASDAMLSYQIDDMMDFDQDWNENVRFFYMK